MHSCTYKHIYTCFLSKWKYKHWSFKKKVELINKIQYIEGWIDTERERERGGDRDSDGIISDSSCEIQVRVNNETTDITYE